MKSSPWMFSLLAVLALGTARAAPVPLDLSGAFNYDAVGTRNEIEANPGTLLSKTLGDHDLLYASAFTDQNSVPPGQTALPNEVVVGEFRISTSFDNSAGKAKAKNALFIEGKPKEGGSVTVSFPTEQRKRYRDLNILFVAHRSEPAGATVQYRSSINAKYEGGGTETVYEAKGAVSENGRAGGTFGSALVGGLGGFTHPIDPDKNVVVAHTSTWHCGIGGSPAVSMVRNPARYLWKFAQPLPLNPKRVLKGLTFTVFTSMESRFNRLWIFAASATPAD